jgi:hypothetical protein
VLLVGLGGDAQDGVADAELGLAEEGGVVAADEVAGDVQQVLVGGLGDGGGQRLGLGFRRGGEGLLHGGASRTREVDFSAKRRSPHLCTKIPPTVETPTPEGGGGVFPLASGGG